MEIQQARKRARLSSSQADLRTVGFKGSSSSKPRVSGNAALRHEHRGNCCRQSDPELSVSSLRVKRVRLPKITGNSKVVKAAASEEDLLANLPELTMRDDFFMPEEPQDADELPQDSTKTPDIQRGNTPGEPNNDTMERLSETSSVDLSQFAEEQVAHNWLLESENLARKKKVAQRQNMLSIRLPDEDPVESIEKRLSEIQRMTNPRKDELSALDRMPPKQREAVKKVMATSLDDIKKANRKGSKLIHKFRWAVRLITVLLGGFRDISRYYKEKQNQSQLREQMEEKMGGVQKTTDSRCSIGYDMYLYLISQPHTREAKAFKKIMWLLKATRAFKHLFPAEMEKEVARYVGYEKYDDGRVLGFQGRKPDRFYYIITGRVGILREIALYSGHDHVTKLMGFLTKGMTTDSQEMEKQWLREATLVATGNVEVLVIDKQIYSYLQGTSSGPPVEFLRGIRLFEDFPVEKFKEHQDAAEYKYYGQGNIIVRDSNRTPWIHIVKSGLVKVLRRQLVVDAQAANESKFISPRIEKIGYGKTFSHASVMLGVQAKQRKFKSDSKLALPQIGNEHRGYTPSPHTPSIGVQVQIVKARSLDSPNTGSSSAKSARSDSSSTSPMDTRNKRSLEEMEEDSPSQDLSAIPEDASLLTSTSANSGTPQRRVHMNSAIINIPMRSENKDEYRPHNMWLTREKTEHESVFSKTSKKKERPQRRAYLQLDKLNPGDIFGLDHLHPAIASEARGVSLVSEGAEIIKISKRFFLQHAGNNTMLKIETMYKEYLTEEEASEALFEKETWSMYKDALWKRVSAGLTPPSVR